MGPFVITVIYLALVVPRVGIGCSEGGALVRLDPLIQGPGPRESYPCPERRDIFELHQFFSVNGSPSSVQPP
jgi:hypothetical protein